jgi:hypothetical protein
MPMTRWVGFIGASNTSRSVNVNAERTVNLFPELDALGTAKEREIAALVSTPGLLKLSTLGTGPVRGLYRASTGNVFAVSGTGLYEVTVPTAPVLLATGTTGSGRVGMADNGVHLVLVDGAKGYALNLATGVVVEITDPEFPKGANTVQFLDQYLIVNEPGTGRFWFSAISDATSWNGLDFGSAEGSPDVLLTLLVDHRELWLFGDRSVEVFFNSGDADNPFQRMQGAFLEEGAIAGTVQKLDNTVFFVSINEKGEGIVKRAQGYVPQRISTHAVEFAISGYANISSATSYTYQDRGHSFYVLNFPSADTTWAFDVASGLWHERTYTPVDGSPMQRHRAENHIFDGTRHLVGDYVNGNLYQFDDSTFTDDGAPISRLRRALHISNVGARISHHAFQLDLEAGVGLASGNGSDPQAMLRWSNDGGHSWSDEHWASMGKQGEYTRRAIWRRLGQSRDRVYEVKCTEPTKQIWISAYLETEAAAH